MPAEIDAGIGHRVLHCDSRADRPTATSSTSGERRTDSRAHSPVGARDNAGGPNAESRRGAPEGDRRRGTSSRHEGEGSPGVPGIPRTGDEEEAVLGGRDCPTKSRVPTRPSRRGRRGGGGAGLAGACRATGDVKDASFPLAWDSPRAGHAVGETDGRTGSRLRGDEEEERRRQCRRATATADASDGGRHRSLRDRSWAGPRPHEREILGADPTVAGRPQAGTPRAAGGNSPLSSHRSRTRAAKEETYEEFGFEEEDVGAGGSFGEELGKDDARRTDPRNETDQDSSASRKRIGRAYPLLQLACLLLVVASGRRGTHGSSGVLGVDARPVASGLSVLGIGIVGAVNARSVEPVAGDAGTRAERSANLSHMTGPYRRKIQMYIKNRHLQILPDGTVNGSNDDTSDYTIFQRRSIGKDGQLTIQGIATCLFLCMDVCGGLYGSPNCTEECVFNETLEQHNYNTYSSVRWSTANRTLYLGLDRYGHPKKVQARAHNLGRLSANARVLTQVAPPDRVEVLQRRILGGQHKVRHRHHHHRQTVDDASPLNCPPRVSSQERDGRDRFRCRKRKKRKKRRRRCRPGEQPGPQCQVAEEPVAEPVFAEVAEVASSEIVTGGTAPESKRSCEGAASEEACRRQALSVPAKKRKSRMDGGGDGRNLTLGKNKAPTSNAKKPNVSVADNQSKKPDLTDGKKKWRRRTTSGSRREGTVASSPIRKRHGPGATSSSRGASSPEPLTALLASGERRASTATLSSSPSLPGASTVLFSTAKPGSPRSDREEPPPSPRDHVAASASRRVGKSPRGDAGPPARSKSGGEVAFPPQTAKVPEDTCTYTTTPLSQFLPVPPSSLLSWQESYEDASLVDEEPSSALAVAGELAIVESVESSTLAASDEVVAEVAMFGLNEKNCEDNDMVPQRDFH